jgi:hypothetical protein
MVGVRELVLEVVEHEVGACVVQLGMGRLDIRAGELDSEVRVIVFAVGEAGLGDRKREVNSRPGATGRSIRGTPSSRTAVG